MRIECGLHTLRFLESDFFRTLLELTWSESQSEIWSITFHEAQFAMSLLKNRRMLFIVWFDCAGIEAAILDETCSLILRLIQHRNTSPPCLPRSKLFVSCYEAMGEYIERSLNGNEKVCYTAILFAQKNSPQFRHP